MSAPERGALGPADTPLRAATRFAVELAAWVAVPWALWDRSAVLALLVGAALVAAPAALNVPGDKHVTGIAVPGWVRVGVEVVLHGAAAWALIDLVGGLGGTVAALLVGVVAVVQVPRWRWLLGRSGG